MRFLRQPAIEANDRAAQVASAFAATVLPGPQASAMLADTDAPFSLMTASFGTGCMVPLGGTRMIIEMVDQALAQLNALVGIELRSLTNKGCGLALSR